MKTQSPSSSSADFDFFIGTWHIAHRQLRQRLADCDEWLTFEGGCITSALLAGAGNVDDNIIHHPAGSYRAVTLRSFDPATGNWSIWWLDGRYPTRMDVPMVGSFDQGKGVFYADDSFEGRPIRVRFLWHADGDAPRWEQAFSADGGKTWETNWIMDFRRA
ncbi:DUF1579 domain-containing protein [Massilia sp. CF038]|uniref:DUF1579 domain-containing protein n=1 Tax=Massilia sp. CF038 TaxID=1881045 RepID=UPI00091F62E3|nr:DUF1579 domain-containing protein [Massilia sp. CF038]SHH22840.1 hypothetical protein SAMN05428948_3414 [Massilia sp. CF038]